ncbi:MAG: hypothetical protein M1819_005614 [Sarea resinae]|nr:MAG: hypothetical protein M1819_005614 [Sarea resinae]
MAAGGLHEPAWGGIPLKRISLVSLMFQNSALILIMHYSRIMPLVGGHRYLTSTAVFLNEAIKLAVCLSIALYDISRNLSPSTPATSLFSTLSRAVFTGDSWKLAIPAMLYTLQNSLQYIAVSNLDAATFQVTYQLKIFATAIFSVLLLGRSLSAKKWVALVMLMLGVAIAQAPNAESVPLGSFKDAQSRFYSSRSLEGLRGRNNPGGAMMSKRSATYEGIQEDDVLENPQSNASVGFMAALAACILSGFAGVYFEKVLKDSNASASLWVRNVQLSFYSLFPALFIGVIFKDGEEIAKNGFFTGYNWVVWTAIGFQALGGILVGLCVNYANNIAKNFATSNSIIISFLACIWFFNFEVTTNFLLGTTIVIFATYLYSRPDRPRPPPIKIVKYEKTTIDRDPPTYEEKSLNVPTTPMTGEGSDEAHGGREAALDGTGSNIPCSPNASHRSYAERSANYSGQQELRHELEFLEPAFDAFDQNLLRQPQDNRHLRAPRGEMRLSLPVGLPPGHATMQHPNYEGSYPESPLGHAQGYSSPPNQLLSSPSVWASQRPGRVQQSQRRDPNEPVHDIHRPAQREHRLPISSPQPLALRQAPPIVHGIQLVSLDCLPDRFRSVFPYPILNAVQSKCFEPVYNTNDNFVLSAPTGSGKTAVLELAICRLLLGFRAGQYKVIYQAPTKSLCSERWRDWQAKFTPLGLKCAELTGDTEHAQLRNVQHADIIITTPEKWDSITRKWKDHRRLMDLIKLFLVDEIHILKDTRGATLEAVVSRMKSLQSDVRFIALSATVPNSDDVATWLGKSSTSVNLPAIRQVFGEDFRPVKLQKFVYGFMGQGNDFALDKVLDKKLPDLIIKHSHKKPVMIFCPTRNSAISTAKLLSKAWALKHPRDRPWPSTGQRILLQNTELRGYSEHGVAFHHAGLENADRLAVEKAYLEGHIGVICSTSTLAIGVNLPCHLVIVKNTVAWQGSAMQEYADLDVIQMLGRAGRPQFDDTAVAVIMTRKEKVEHYERIVSGQEILESCLHLHLIEHLNAEIALGTICDAHSAKRWLCGTFLYVRLKQNPKHYKMEGDLGVKDVDERLEHICNRDIGLLQDIDLVTAEGRLECTDFGDAMSRYYMRIFLSAVAQADEFREVRLKGGEKPLYKEINKGLSIKFPINVDIALPAHKVSLIIQSELGGAEFPSDEQYQRHKAQYQQDRTTVFQHIHRLIRCLIDCQLYLKDAVSSRNALELARSFSARAWDDSPLQLKQVEQIGPVAVRKFASAGINSIEALEATEPHRIEMIMSRNPPWGNRILNHLKQFPKPRVSMKMMGQQVKNGQGVQIRIKADIGFLNEKVPAMLNRKPIYMCFLAESSDGYLFDFRRMSAQKLGDGQEFVFPAALTNADQYITGYVMCDEIAGTLRYAVLKPDVSPTLFPAPALQLKGLNHNRKGVENASANISRRRSLDSTHSARRVHGTDIDEFGDSDLDDGDMLAAANDSEFIHIEDFDDVRPLTRKNTLNNSRLSVLVSNTEKNPTSEEAWHPEQMENGKWACNHKCKDKTACKHLCCREGMAKPPKPRKSSSTTTGQIGSSSQPHARSTIEDANLQPKSRRSTATTDYFSSTIRPEPEILDLSSRSRKEPSVMREPRARGKLERLHLSTQKSKNFATGTLRNLEPTFSYEKGSQPSLSFLGNAEDADDLDQGLSDYDDSWIDELPSPSLIIARPPDGTVPSFHLDDTAKESSRYDENLTDLEESMVGLHDSVILESNRDCEQTKNDDPTADDHPNYWADWSDSSGQDESLIGLPHLSPRSDACLPEKSKGQSLFFSTDSPEKVDGSGIAPSPKSAKRTRDSSEMVSPFPQRSPPRSKKSRVNHGIADSSLCVSDHKEPATGYGALPTKTVDESVPPGWEKIDPELLAGLRGLVDFI